MTEFEVYIFLLCFIVFFVLTIVFYLMIGLIVKYMKRSILAGFDDDKIIKQSLREERKKESSVSKTFEIIFNVLLSFFFVFIFASSLFVKYSKNDVTQDIPTLRVVESGSMSYKNKSNKYLIEHDLNEQMQVFDLIVTRKLPGEMELELYDVVVYEYDGKLLIHRIIGIEEPNEKHPDQRYFLLQGDANVYPDRFPVLYSQMKAIYEGERYANVGSIFSFFQSPAGYLCVLLIITSIFIGPYLDKQLYSVTQERLGYIYQQQKKITRQIYR